jgi:formylmethanofuran dehydrogenase subunit B
VSERIAIDEGDLLDAVTCLTALAAGRRIAATSLPVAALAALAQGLAAARYGVIFWDITAFPEPARAPAATLLLALLRHLTLKTRCVGLPLGGADNAAGAAQTMLWQAGWPGRLSFAGGTPRHDPYLYDAERLVASRELDALLWVSPLSAAAPPTVNVPTVALLPADAAESKAHIVIRVGVPALDHGGAVLRADTVVALPLAASRPSLQPSVAAAAQAILAQLPVAS